MKRTVLLYGELGKRFGRRHQFAVRNVAEAIRALKANFKGFETYLCTADQSNVGFRVLVGKEQLNSVEEIHNPTGQSEVFKIVPVVMGSEKSPFVKILLGAALVAAAVFIPGAPAALGYFGAAMIIGGVAQMLTKPPAQTGGYQEQEQKDSYLFNGPVNTSVQGTCVSVVYGRMIVGSKVISAGIESHEFSE